MTFWKKHNRNTESDAYKKSFNLKEERERDFSLYNYRRDIPVVLLYQFITKAILLLSLRFFQELNGIILWNNDRPAFATGTYNYLMKTWQGWVVTALGLVSLAVYTVFDVNTTIIMSDKLLHGKEIKVRTLLRETVKSIKWFLSPLGILVVLYVTLAGPFFGAPFGISLTTNFTVPEKIMSIIFDNFIYKVLYYIGMVLAFGIGFFYIFTFQYAILGRMKLRKALEESRKAVTANWKNYVYRMGTFIIRSALLFAVIALSTYIIPISIIHRIIHKGYWYHVGIVFFTSLAVLSVIIYLLVLFYFAAMKLTMIYESYTEEDEGAYLFPEKRKSNLSIALVSIALFVIIVFSVTSSFDFDRSFPAVYSTNIIAHRAGGYMANENSLLGLEKSAEKGIRFAEIDVQRTNDGWYVVNHDATFERNCGVNKTADEMSLDEVLDLNVKNQFNPTKPDTKVATLDEMLNLAKKKNIHLYIELKGKTADKQMAEEVYDIVDSFDMVKDVTFISMKFKTIYYLEMQHPEAETGYLCFYSYGAVRRMRCDALLLESSAAIQTNIKVAHANGKKVYVWTVNSVNGMTNFLTSNVDGIITDEVEMAQSTMKLLDERNDEARVLQRFLTEWKMSNSER